MRSKEKDIIQEALELVRNGVLEIRHDGIVIRHKTKMSGVKKNNGAIPQWYPCKPRVAGFRNKGGYLYFT